MCSNCRHWSTSSLWIRLSSGIKGGIKASSIGRKQNVEMLEETAERIQQELRNLKGLQDGIEDFKRDTLNVNDDLLTQQYNPILGPLS